jgi:microcystin-dependent protein
MSEPFIGAITMFAGNFAPRGWAFCSGQLLSIAQNTALFSLLGTTYGGNGQTTFALPNLQSRAPIHFGQGPGLSSRDLGEMSGTETVTLTSNEIPGHVHAAKAGTAGNVVSPANAYWSTDPAANTAAYSTEPVNSSMAAGAIAPAGGSQPHENRQPYACINYIIALEGIFPSRN